MPAAPLLKSLCYFKEPGGGSGDGGNTDSLSVSLACVVDVGGQGSYFIRVTLRVKG